MLQIDSLRIAPGTDMAVLHKKAAAALNIHPKGIRSLRILRRSIDAREEVLYVYSVAVEAEGEEELLLRNKNPRVRLYVPPQYTPPPPIIPPAFRPVVVGAGPAGLFCTLLLAKSGLRPILLERGQRVEERRAAVERFWRDGILDTNSNVQFGEGGAGAFSDGKLNTGTRDPRHAFILQTFVEHGAPEDILIDAKPHIGTDKLYVVLQNLRRSLTELGAEIRFCHRLTEIEQRQGRLHTLHVAAPEGNYQLPTQTLALAIGHSARDTFAMLERAGVAMEAKPFAVGVRIEHRQSAINAVQYKKFAASPYLPAASYKLATHLPDGRGIFSFCVCPGGTVVAAASEEGQLVTNGMSCFARDGENINGGLLVSCTPEDFGTGAMDGVRFQRQLEEAAFALGGGDYRAPAQLVGDFLAGRTSTASGSVVPSYRPDVRFCDLRECLPPFVAESLCLALPELDRKLHGFAAEDAVLTAVETRSSSPLRILRDAQYNASLRGLYPCGEGAGYAGGIMSAAADGMRCAENIWRECCL